MPSVSLQSEDLEKVVEHIVRAGGGSDSVKMRLLNALRSFNSKDELNSSANATLHSKGPLGDNELANLESALSS